MHHHKYSHAAWVTGHQWPALSNRHCKALYRIFIYSLVHRQLSSSKPRKLRWVLICISYRSTEQRNYTTWRWMATIIKKRRNKTGFMLFTYLIHLNKLQIKTELSDSQSGNPSSPAVHKKCRVHIKCQAMKRWPRKECIDEWISNVNVVLLKDDSFEAVDRCPSHASLCCCQRHCISHQLHTPCRPLLNSSC